MSNQINYVYFISDGEYVKIGRTNNVEVRLKILQSANARRLSVLRVIRCKSAIHSQKIEMALHERFESNRLIGEWFNISNQDVKAIREENILKLQELKHSVFDSLLIIQNSSDVDDKTKLAIIEDLQSIVRNILIEHRSI